MSTIITESCKFSANSHYRRYLRYLDVIFLPENFGPSMMTANPSFINSGSFSFTSAGEDLFPESFGSMGFRSAYLKLAYLDGTDYFPLKRSSVL